MIANLNATIIGEAQFTQVYWRVGILFAFVIALFIAALLITKIVIAKNSRSAKRAPGAGGDHTLSTSWLTDMKSQSETPSEFGKNTTTPGATLSGQESTPPSERPVRRQQPQDPSRIFRPAVSAEFNDTKMREPTPSVTPETAPTQTKAQPGLLPSPKEPESPFGQVDDFDIVASSGSD
jgi:hypothetical protein